MQLEQRIVGDVAIVRVSGEITLKRGGDAMLHDKVRSLIEQGHKRVLVDMAGVSYIDSAGLGELVQAYSTTRNHGGSLKLFNPTERLRNLLVLTQLTALFGKCDYDDEAQALASFGGPHA
ncbi:MAG: STAS domain-containing protein [Vicinamibacterales bacterium]